MVPPSFVDLGPKLRELPWGSGNGSKWPNSGPEAEKQPAELSRVTSGYGGLMIPLSRVRPTQKNGGYIGVA